MSTLLYGITLLVPVVLPVFFPVLAMSPNAEKYKQVLVPGAWYLRYMGYDILAHSLVSPYVVLPYFLCKVLHHNTAPSCLLAFLPAAGYSGTYDMICTQGNVHALNAELLDCYSNSSCCKRYIKGEAKRSPGTYVLLLSCTGISLMRYLILGTS